jgi:hypothetical protein
MLAIKSLKVLEFQDLQAFLHSKTAGSYQLAIHTIQLYKLLLVLQTACPDDIVLK